MATIPATCKAAALVGFGQPMALMDVQVPAELEPGAILVKMSMASVCATDVHAWDGSSSFAGHHFPSILGHEMTGRIVRLGEGVTKDSVGTPLREGDRIVWTHGFCGQCVNCIVENERTLCLNRRPWHGVCTEYPYLTGGFAEYGYVFPTSGRIRVPDEIPDELAAAASCSLRTVIHGFDRVGAVDDRQSVVIQGSGPLGLFSLARAYRSGASNVIVIGGPARRLEVARRWGAAHTIDIDEVPDPADRTKLVLEWTGGLGADLVVEVSGARTAFLEGFEILRRGGRYLVIGQLHGETVPFRPADIVRKNAHIVGTASASVQHYHRAMQFLLHNADRFDWMAMISNRYPLARINEALAGMQRWEEIKPVITFDN
jgi:threonine dehydrogenase-like Zn-dependent dehydrogenase